MNTNALKSSTIRLPLAIALVGIALGVGGCSKSGQPPPDIQPGTTSSPTQGSSSSPSTPAAAPSQGSSSSGTTPSDTAKASDPPMAPMTKEGESKAMPMPGQANDHSTLANDKKK